MFVAMMRTDTHPPEPGHEHSDSAKKGTSYRRDWLRGTVTSTFAPGRSTNDVDLVADGTLLVRLSTRSWAPPASAVSTAAAVPVRMPTANREAMTAATRLVMRDFMIVPFPWLFRPWAVSRRLSGSERTLPA